LGGEQDDVRSASGFDRETDGVLVAEVAKAPPVDLDGEALPEAIDEVLAKSDRLVACFSVLEEDDDGPFRLLRLLVIRAFHR